MPLQVGDNLTVCWADNAGIIVVDDCGNKYCLDTGDSDDSEG